MMYVSGVFELAYNFNKSDDEFSHKRSRVFGSCWVEEVKDHLNDILQPITTRTVPPMRGHVTCVVVM